MNIGEAQDVNVVLGRLLGAKATEGGRRRPVNTDDEVRDAAARLADRARKTLSAGYAGEQVRQDWRKRGMP